MTQLLRESGMREQHCHIGGIPAILYGKPSARAYLFVHGQYGRKEEAEAFADVVCPAGYQVLSIDLPEHGDRQGEHDLFNPWTVVPQLREVLGYMRSRWRDVGLRATSIGAHFSMLAFQGTELRRALFVSPIVNMELLIADMMQKAGVSEQDLEARHEIVTDDGQTLSWRYLLWERKHPVVNWTCPTAILYASGDVMTDRRTVETFADVHHATLTVMDDGEHWFHTPAQLAALRVWESSSIQE
ncbi:MAG: alpha/beta hydrolase [Bifidobacterium sp.]|jgi:alpha-beta hydrolase superfamily lysophospholipase